MPDTTLVLGDFTFADTQVPPKITYGGQQSLAIHKLVGGARVIDAMGADDQVISWSGLIRGPNAVATAQQLDALRRAGAELDLTWSGFSYSVVIRSFEADFERFYQIPYRISCEVVADNTQPVTSSSTPPVDQSIQLDALTASSSASAIGNAGLSSAISTMVSAIQAVPSFVTAAQSTVTGVLATVGSAQTALTSLIGTTAAAIGTPTTFGGVLPGVAGSGAAQALSAAATNTASLASLYGLQGVLGRLRTNMTAAGSGSNSVTLAGGNLFQLAAQEYGDPTAWTTIAAANGLTDPFIQGTDTLVIPPQPDGSDGILSA